MPVRTVAPAELDALDDAQDLHVAGAWPEVLDCDGLGIDGCHFESPAAQSISLRRSRVLDTRVSDPEVVTVTAAQGHWRDVEVSGGRIAALELHGARLSSVALRGVRLGFVNLRDATLERLTVVDCTIDTLDLTGACAAGISFSGTRIRDLDATRATFKDVDLRGAALTVVTGVERLRGCTVTTDQLLHLSPLLARALGITVAE